MKYYNLNCAGMLYFISLSVCLSPPTFLSLYINIQ